MYLQLATMLNQAVVTQIAIFGAVAAVAWWVLDLTARQKPRAEQRLDEFREPNARKGDGVGRDGKAKGAGAMAKALAKASPALSAPLQPKSADEVNKTREKLNMSGFRGENAPQMYWSLKGCFGSSFATISRIFRRTLSEDTSSPALE